jgi:3',5'-nucleoside bisphosphate phosphatase
MLIDIHLHSSRHSACSTADPVDLVRAAAGKNLQGVVITEHHYLWSGKELEQLREEAELGPHFLILAGQEVDTDIGHVLVFGAGRSIRNKLKLSELRRLFPEAALVWAHPFRGSEPLPEELLNPHLDAVEIINTNHTAREHYRALELWHRCRFTAVAGSDAHAPRLAGVFPTSFDHPVKTIRKLAGEIRAGRCRPFLKEIPRAGGNTVVTAINLGAKGEDEYRQRLILRRITSRKKWKQTGTALEVVAALLERGFGKGRYRVPKIIEVDEKEKIVIEEGQRGKLLFDLLPEVSPRVGGRYFRMAARWLGRLHRERLRIGEAERTRKKEEKKFESYLERFENAGHPGRERFRTLLEWTRGREEELLERGEARLVQVHGDYHPKNIIIGQDRMQDISTLFISVIDFDNSLLFDPAFDVGAFLSQFRYQFRHFPRIRGYCREEDFLKAYLGKRRDVMDDFVERVRLFRVRANLSIANYLVKVGQGDSPDLDQLLAESETLIDKSGHTSIVY